MTEKKASKSGDDLGQSEVQEKKDAEEAQGFHGIKADPTPDEHYTVAGVTAGKPTPETDADAAAKASQTVGTKFEEGK